MLQTTSAQAPDSDDALVPRILAGESALFEHIMRRHNQRLFRTARAILNDDAEAEDVMQETYTRAFAHLGRFRGEAQLGTWLVRIALHEAFARVRRRRRLAPLPPSDDDVETLPMPDRPMPIDPERVSEEVVKTRLSRARLGLRDQLYERAGAVASSAFTFGAERCDRIVAAVLPRLVGKPA